MGIVVWAAVAGVLLGWAADGFDGGGALLGGLIGAGMGHWLRVVLRAQIDAAVRAALDGFDLPMPGPTAPAEPAAEPPAAPQRQPARARARRATDPLEPGAARTSPWEPAAAEPTSPPAQPQPQPQLRPAEPQPAAEHPAAPVPGGLAADLLGRARDWLLGGNTIVRAGLAVLFVGLVFLARLAANAGLFPIELRLIVIGLAGLALLLVGFGKRRTRPGFALSLQGGGVAVLYLVVFAATRGYAVMPPLAGFAFMILFAALGCALALMQDSLAMALASFLGGFAVPVLLGGQSETPLGLFTYLTVLNLAILVIAGRRSWRPLNLLGFAATFLLATLWGFAAYEPRHFALCEIFLALSIAIYLATALLYAHNTPGRLGNYADSTLLFGTALVGFGLQAGLVHDRPFASAYSALAFGAVYLGAAAWIVRRREPGMRLLGDCLLAIGVGFVTMAVPLALAVKWTATTWALEGAGAVWVGARQARWLPRAFGLALQGVAGVMVLATLEPNVASLPLLTQGVLLPVLVAAPALFTAWLLRHPLPHSGSAPARAYAAVEQELGPPWFLAGFVMACLAILREVGRITPVGPAGAHRAAVPVLAAHWQIMVAMLAILGAMALAQLFARRRDWAVAGWPARASLPLVALSFAGVLAMGRNVLYWPDALAWAAAAGAHLWLLRHAPRGGWTHAMHVGGPLLGTALTANALWLGVERSALWDTSWAGVVFLGTATTILAALTRWAGASVGAPPPPRAQRWPLAGHAPAYWWHAALVLAVLVYVGALLDAVLSEGVTAPLPYVPLLNPADLAALLALAVLALWRRTVGAAAPPPPAARDLCGVPGLVAGGVLAFAIVNAAWLRTAHHALGVGWSAAALAGSQAVQSGLSLLWTLLAMGLMLFAHRRAQRRAWLAGAVLLGVVVAKLVLVDMSGVEGIARIVAFIGVGVLMLLIGYFVPLPPRGEAAAPVATDAQADR